MNTKHLAILIVITLSIFACIPEADARPTYAWDPEKYGAGMQDLGPTAVVPFQRWTPQQVIDVFVAHGLEVGDYYTASLDDFWGTPYEPPTIPVGNMRFLIPSLCETCGGRILSFENSEALLSTKYYYLEIGRANAFLFSWVLEKDNILVQINGFVEQETVQKYEQALRSLGE